MCSAYNMPPLCNALLIHREQYAPHQYARAYNMPPQGLYNGLIFALILGVIVQGPLMKLITNGAQGTCGRCINIYSGLAGEPLGGNLVPQVLMNSFLL